MSITVDESDAHRVETGTAKEKSMKKQIAALSKSAQEKLESEYHRMKPQDFDATMAQAKLHKPDARSSTKRKTKATGKKRAA
jgi:hypothetical protein